MKTVGVWVLLKKCDGCDDVFVSLVVVENRYRVVCLTVSLYVQHTSIAVRTYITTSYSIGTLGNAPLLGTNTT
jgi:hypothetical protein